MMKIEKIIRKANYWATPIYEHLPSSFFPERHLRFKAYCVGMGKTGTITLHIMFSKHYRTAHEPESRFLANKFVAFAHDKINKSDLIKYVKQRDRRLSLEMDASHLNIHLLDILVNEFSEAKFFLTIRDCYSWLDSAINHRLARPGFAEKRAWLRHLSDLRLGADRFKHAKEEKVLVDNGLYTLDGYFSWWKTHNTRVLSTVPSERLLVVKTPELTQSIPQIETFLGITPGSLPTSARGNVTTKKFNILSQIDKDFLEEKANFHCKELMDKYFPEVKGYSNPARNATESN
ncbi:MAG: hypothetical protein KAI83_13330 [Thiomargarita sp.]|nr:hypothetical protein [Thiomargarita sp.]